MIILRMPERDLFKPEWVVNEVDLGDYIKVINFERGVIYHRIGIIIEIKDGDQYHIIDHQREYVLYNRYIYHVQFEFNGTFVIEALRRNDFKKMFCHDIFPDVLKDDPAPFPFDPM